MLLWSGPKWKQEKHMIVDSYHFSVYGLYCIISVLLIFICNRSLGNKVSKLSANLVADGISSSLNVIMLCFLISCSCFWCMCNRQLPLRKLWHTECWMMSMNDFGWRRNYADVSNLLFSVCGYTYSCLLSCEMFMPAHINCKG